MPRLNSHDDFTPLKEVIVGSAANYLSHERDVSFELFHHENLTGFRSDWAYPRLTPAAAGHRESWAIKERYAEELHEDVEALATTLAGLGAVVHRPLPLPEDAAPIAGLGWEAAPTPALNIRDNTLILGDEIIETPPAIRSRYLETRLLAPVFTGYWEDGARWTTMPRPTLTDNSFDLSYARDTAIVTLPGVLLLDAAGPEAGLLARPAAARGHQVHAATAAAAYAGYGPELKGLLAGRVVTDFARPDRALDEIASYARRRGVGAVLTVND